MKRVTPVLWGLITALFCPPGHSTTVFVEAEEFVVAGDGWRPFSGHEGQTRPASRARTLWGGDGAGDSTASATLTIPAEGTYRLWVRYLKSPWRGPFHLAVRQNDREVAGQDFDLAAKPDVADWQYGWESLDSIPLAPGEVTVQLSKYEGQNCNIYTRHVDCVVLTDDLNLVPNHLDFGPQTYLRVTLGNVYEQPVYVHVFADHYRDPWYAHYAISKAGLEEGLVPTRAEAFLRGGESTGWVNISPLVYQDSGVIMVTSIRYDYHHLAPKLQAKFEFATAPEDQAILKTFEREAEPGVISLLVPPDFAQPENWPNLVMDLDVAEATGRVADAMTWPTVGRKPTLYPFFVCESSSGGWWPQDRKVVDRERKTLDYFGFSNWDKEIIGGLWYMQNDCYCQPDLPKMKAAAQQAAEEFRGSGKKVSKIVYAMLMDEPGGPPASHLANCSVCTERFREWLKELGKAPADLLVADWEEVQPVEEARADDQPALYYYTHKFRTRALSRFMRVQREILHEAYGGSFPVNVNFSDGATYYANFYAQGVDYFELLASDDQNAIWGENWGNGAASPQCTTYNVELMRSAAMKRGQHLGHYLIAYAGRLPWDVKLNAVSQAARGVKVFNNFWYGPSWAGHEGGPLWNCSAWYSKPETWYANAELVREFGGAEDLLFPAQKVQAQVAILYASSTDIWTLGKNYAYGFDRMFTWLALTHAQIPVDFLSEQGVEGNGLDGYRVCYLSGPNLTRECAATLRAWVERGGTLVLTAGAGERDEYNRPLTLLEDLMPAGRGEVEELQPYLNSGAYLHLLKSQDTVTTTKDQTPLAVLSVKQTLTTKEGSQVLGTFQDGSPAFLSWKKGTGTVYCAGFLPGLAYMQPAILARNRVLGKVNPTGVEEAGLPDPAEVVPEEVLVRRSHCPWAYPEDIRAVLTLPVREAQVNLPLQCSVPLVDAVLMESDQGAVVPLANYTLQPLKEVTLAVQTAQSVQRVESVHQGRLPFRRVAENRVEFSLPLQETDFVKLYYTAHGHKVSSGPSGSLRR